MGALGLVIVLTVLYYLIDNENRATQPQATLLIGIVLGMTISVFQMMAVLSAMSIPWVDPIKSMLNTMRALDFDIDLLRFGCFMSLTPVMKYIAKLGVILVILSFISIIHIAWVLLRYRGRPSSGLGVRWGWAPAVNLVSVLVLLFATVGTDWGCQI